MDDKIKIVLASEDVFPKNIDDIFININLNRKFNIIKKGRIDNNFDLAEQFRKERNISRSFRIYGIIDSTILNCDNLLIKVWSKSTQIGLTQNLSGLIYTTNSQSIGFGDKNVFGKMRGKYIIELDNYLDSDTIFLEIEGDGVSYARTIIEQQLVFKDADGQFVEYGTQTVDIGESGLVVEIDNDFPFFYNKHWIKNNFQIEEVKVRNVSFVEPSYSILEGQSKKIMLRLDEPSVFGNEKVTVNLTTPTLETFENAAPGIDFTVDTPPLGFPIEFSWAVGERDKEIDISALNDFIIEKNPETFSISLILPENLTIGQGVVNINSTTISIIDQTPKKYVSYNFQKIIRNINPLTNTVNVSENLGQLPGFEMNIYGAKTLPNPPSTANANYRFFPNDDFELTIKNEGDTTTLPIIPGITNAEQFFGAGDSITITVENKYQNHNSLPREEAVFRFNQQFAVGFGSSFYVDEFFINGLRFNPTALVANNFVQSILQKYELAGAPMPFTINQVGAIVTLIAKHPANNINGFIPRKPSGFGSFNYALQGFSETPDYPNGRVANITEQEPFFLNLYANSDGATTCKYSFVINKIGYKPIQIEPSTFIATSIPNKVYLVTPIKDVFGPSLPVTDINVCNPSTNSLDVDGYYLNGVALLAAPLFGSEEATATNSHSSGFLPSFRQNPLTSNLVNCSNLIGISKVLS